MKKNPFVTICFIILLFLSVNAKNASAARKKNSGFLSNLKNFSNSVQNGRDLLQETFQQVNQMEEEYLEETGEFPKEVAQILATLKNPFIPQLPKPPEPPPPQEGGQPVVPIEGADEPEIFDEKMEIETPQRQKVPPPQFTMSGLVWNSDRPQAILNSQVVDVGDTIQECTILKIDKKGVEFSFQDRIFNIEP